MFCGRSAISVGGQLSVQARARCVELTLQPGDKLGGRHNVVNGTDSLA